MSGFVLLEAKSSGWSAKAPCLGRRPIKALLAYTQDRSLEEPSRQRHIDCTVNQPIWARSHWCLRRHFRAGRSVCAMPSS